MPLQVRATYVEKVSGKIGDLFRGYWAHMDRVEVGGWLGGWVAGFPFFTLSFTSYYLLLHLHMQYTLLRTVSCTPCALLLLPQLAPLRGRAEACRACNGWSRCLPASTAPF